MKTLIILGIVTSILVITGIFFASAGMFEKNTESTQKSPTCSSCQNGGCTKTNNCASLTCGTVTGETCGCNRG